MSPLTLKVTRALFALLEATAPRFASSVAFGLFSRTPDPRRPSSRERAAIERFAPLMEDARRHRLRVGDGHVMAHVFKPLAGAGIDRTALVIHGWNSRADHMIPIVMQLRAAGFRVVAIDLPGHGRSSGRHATMASAVAACSEAEIWFGPFDVIVGHSFGGAVALNALFGSVRDLAPVATEQLVLIAAPNAIVDIFDDFSRLVGLGRRTRHDLDERVRRLTGTPVREFVGARQLAKLGVGTLVLHAPDDREVAFADAVDLADAGDHVELRSIPGVGHRRILSDAKALDAIAGFVGGGEPEAREFAQRSAAAG